MYKVGTILVDDGIRPYFQKECTVIESGIDYCIVVNRNEWDPYRLDESSLLRKKPDRHNPDISAEDCKSMVETYYNLHSGQQGKEYRRKGIFYKKMNETLELYREKGWNDDINRMEASIMKWKYGELIIEGVEYDD
ncbi:hypothetical protein KKA69_05325 [Patescibacteria group bacterium]|nr:hypothetical protein [Patescibacteria group bacterium]